MIRLRDYGSENHSELCAGGSGRHDLWIMCTEYRTQDQRDARRGSVQPLFHRMVQAQLDSTLLDSTRFWYQLAWNLDEGDTKKMYQVPGTVHNF
ncbi:hypothetical protein ANANG_G00062470, partial [Anguilla anguilla]